MDILINGERVDVTLEQEKTVGEVIDGVREWIQNSGYLVTDIQKDGKSLDTGDPDAWSALPLEGIAHLGFTAVSTLEYRLARYRLLFRYVSDFSRFLQEKDSASLRTLAAEYPSVETDLAVLLGGLPRERSEDRGREEHAVTAFFRQYTDDVVSGAVPESAGSERDELALTGCAQILLLLSERIREIESPLNELRATLRGLAETVPQISDVSILLQTGKDREAMTNVIRFTELSAKLIRLYPLLSSSGQLDTDSISVDGSSFEEFYTDFNRVLLELLEAFRAQDSVLIGDLLEYEVAPRIDRFLAAASD